jgi:hypothetical protein
MKMNGNKISSYYQPWGNAMAYLPQPEPTSSPVPETSQDKRHGVTIDIILFCWLDHEHARPI